MKHNLKELLQNNFDIGEIIDIQETQFGSGGTFLVETYRGRYIGKTKNKPGEVELYNLVQKYLRGSEINQPELIPARSGKLLGEDGIALFEYIPSNTLKQFKGEMERKAINYIYGYNQELKKIPLAEVNLGLENDWDRLRSLNYICAEARKRIKSTSLQEDWKNAILEGIEVLAENQDELAQLPHQLIHSDLGADNFLVSAGDIIAVIDFSPDINNELYSLAHFTYWNYLWLAKELKKEALQAHLNYYGNTVHERVFFLLLLQASILRVLGPLFEKKLQHLEKRVKIMDWLKGLNLN